MTRQVPYGSRRRPAAISRAPANRPEWERAVFTSSLKLPAKAVVLLVGSYMTWSSTNLGTNAYPGLGRLEHDLGCQVGESALRKYLSDAVRLGLLVVTSDPSPGRACVYRAGVPTGEAAASAGTLPFDVHSPVDEDHHTGTSVPVMASQHRHESRSHRHAGAGDHRHVRAAYPSTEPDNQIPTPTPLPPSPSTGRPLLAVVHGNPGGTTPPAGTLTSTPIPRHVELVAAGLVASLPDDLPAPIASRWERRAAVHVARLLAGGWTTDRLLEVVIRPSWHGVANAGAVLVSRLQALEAVPAQHPTGVPWCGECDQQRQREDASGRMFRCPSCHPLALAAPPF